jgi:uncharacterized membrane protein
MDRGRARLAFVLMALGSVVLAWVAAARGELELYLFLIFPVIKVEGVWGAASLLLALGAFIFLVFSLLPRGLAVNGSLDRSAGGVVLIGPFPIILGTDRRTTIIALAVAVTVLASLLFLLL